jgi:hypothetical protein
MTREDFERLLEKAVVQLNAEVLASTQHHKPDAFEKRVFEVLKSVAQGEKIEVSPSFHPHAFPDIKANGFGVEVKSTSKDSWLTVGNSVFEGMRDQSVEEIYVVFGKMGGMPSVRSGRYAERITHVRISHAPRFVLEMDRDSSLFEKIKVSYDIFCRQPPEEKMRHIRQYTRGRLKPGEQIWWLEDEDSEGINVSVRLYTSCKKDEKIKFRAESTLLFPGVLAGGRARGKYNKVGFFLLKYHNVFCHQLRDLFTAGSVAGKERGGKYLPRALKHIEPELLQAMSDLDLALFEEYWEVKVRREDIMTEWLRQADANASGWKPSEHLFLKQRGLTT